MCGPGKSKKQEVEVLQYSQKKIYYPGSMVLQIVSASTCCQHSSVRLENH